MKAGLSSEKNRTFKAQLNYFFVFLKGTSVPVRGFLPANILYYITARLVKHK